MKDLKSMNVGDFANYEEIMSFGEDYYQTFVEETGEIVGVATCILQGGNDECYIFVCDVYSAAEGAIYKLVYKY